MNLSDFANNNPMPASSLPSYFAQEMMNLHAKYGLSENSKVLLRAHDDYKMGRIDQEELGRLVRMSANMRQALTDTITKCAATLKKKPEDSKNCIDIIQACTEILIAREVVPTEKSFPFMRLPSEVRRNVYSHYVNESLNRSVGAVTFPKKSKCDCPSYCPQYYSMTRKFDLSLGRTCKRVREEFYDYFYRTFTVHFTCGCELRERLESDEILRNMLRNVKVHWTGPDSDRGFVMLSKCPGLKGLEVVLSKSTTTYLTLREMEMRMFFTAQKPPRLTDALGLDQLMMIRGIENLTVSHLPARQGTRRSEDDRANLQGLLRSKLKAPRMGDEDNYSTT